MKKIYDITFVITDNTDKDKKLAMITAIANRFASFGGVSTIEPFSNRGVNPDSTSYLVYSGTYNLSGGNFQEIMFWADTANNNPVWNEFVMGFCPKNQSVYNGPMGLSFYSRFNNKIYAATDDNNNLIAIYIKTDGSSYSPQIMYFYRDTEGLNISYINGTKYYQDSKAGNVFDIKSGYMHNFFGNYNANVPSGKVIRMLNVHRDNADIYKCTRDYPVNMIGAGVTPIISSTNTVITGDKKIIVGEQKYFNFGNYQWMPYDEIVTESYSF